MLSFFFIKHKNKHKEHKEHFDNATEQAEENQKKFHGLERCKFLDVTPNELPAEDYVMVQEFVQTNRIKEWKPNNKNNSSIYNSSNDDSVAYCYMYDDPDNAMQDMMMMNCNCDIKRDIFKNNPMIKRVFQNTELDNSHLLPIKKCIIEFDKSERNSSNISKFFGALNDEYCASLARGLTLELTDLQKEYTELYDKNSKQEYNKNVMQSKYDNAYNSNKECNAKNSIVKQNISTYTSSNLFLQSNINIVRSEYELCTDNLAKLWKNTSNTVMELKNDIQGANDKAQIEITDLEKCLDTNTSLQNSISKYMNNNDIILNMNTRLYIENSNLFNSNVQCSNDYNNTKKSADMYLNNYNICFPNINNFNICNPLLTKCHNELSNCIVERNNFIKSYEENNINNEICQSNVTNTMIDIDGCAFSNNIVQTINKEKIVILNNQDLTIELLNKKNIECSTYLKSRIALKQELDRRNEELRKQKEQLIIECTLVKKEKEKASMELAKTQMERKAISDVKNLPSTCDYDNIDAIFEQSSNSTSPQTINLRVEQI